MAIIPSIRLSEEQSSKNSRCTFDLEPAAHWFTRTYPCIPGNLENKSHPSPRLSFHFPYLKGFEHALFGGVVNANRTSAMVSNTDLTSICCGGGRIRFYQPQPNGRPPCSQFRTHFLVQLSNLHSDVFSRKRREHFKSTTVPFRRQLGIDIGAICLEEPYLLT